MEMRAAPDFEARLFEMGFRNLLLFEGRHSASSWEAVWIHCRRLAMSLDNVLAVAPRRPSPGADRAWAVAAAHGLGQRPSPLIARHLWIVWFGAGILGYVAGEMILDHPLVWRWLGAAEGA